MEQNASLFVNLIPARQVRSARQIILVGKAGIEACARFHPDSDLGFLQQVEHTRHHRHAPFGWECFFEYAYAECHLDLKPRSIITSSPGVSSARARENRCGLVEGRRSR